MLVQLYRFSEYCFVILVVMLTAYGKITIKVVADNMKATLSITAEDTGSSTLYNKNYRKVA